MKRMIAVCMCLIFIFGLVACGNTGTSEENGSANIDSADNSGTNTETEPNTGGDTESEAEAVTQGADSNILVAYFSHSGNTEVIANMVADRTGGTLFKVETVKTYPDDYAECTDVAKEEQDNDERPELATHVEDMDQYDVIFLGFPNWWGTLPMAMFTFMEEYDFSGKTIIPFCTHEGSRLGRSEEDIAELAPETELLTGFESRGSAVDGAQADVEDWIDGLGILK